MENFQFKDEIISKGGNFRRVKTKEDVFKGKSEF